MAREGGSQQTQGLVDAKKLRKELLRVDLDVLNDTKTASMRSKPLLQVETIDTQRKE